MTFLTAPIQDEINNAYKKKNFSDMYTHVIIYVCVLFQAFVFELHIGAVHWRNICWCWKSAWVYASKDSNEKSPLNWKPKLKKLRFVKQSDGESCNILQGVPTRGDPCRTMDGTEEIEPNIEPPRYWTPSWSMTPLLVRRYTPLGGDGERIVRSLTCHLFLEVTQSKEPGNKVLGQYKFSLVQGNGLS